MCRLQVIGWSLALLVFCGGAHAQAPALLPAPSPAPVGAPAGNADAKGGTVAAQPPPNTVVPSCNQPTPEPTTTLPPISITVNPATIWQPRGGEVIVAVVGDAALFKGFTLRACFGWSEAAPGKFFTQENLGNFGDAFVRVRPSDTIGLLNIGVIVPNLSDAPSNFLTRWLGGRRSTGLGIVPIADLRLIGYNDAGILFDTVRPVGITSVSFSLLLAILSVTVGVLVLHRLAIGTFPSMPSGAGEKGIPRGLRVIREFLKLRWILYLVQDNKGRASLSAFQILLWSILVAASAIYVMALSGSLINITAGTLVLLGIAGAAGLITAGMAKSQRGDQGQVPQEPIQLPQSQTQPQPQVSEKPSAQWADLVRDDDGKPEVTRLQMLFFTLVSAAFVAMQVLNNYVIPDIPSGYQILMGISNGIYVGKKFT
jgi:hypothetical protein